MFGFELWGLEVGLEAPHKMGLEEQLQVGHNFVGVPEVPHKKVLVEELQEEGHNPVRVQEVPHKMVLVGQLLEGHKFEGVSVDFVELHMIEEVGQEEPLEGLHNQECKLEDFEEGAVGTLEVQFENVTHSKLEGVLFHRLEGVLQWITPDNGQLVVEGWR